MRIIAGTLRGRRLIAPKGFEVRPTSDRAREALFNILEHAAPPLRDCSFLDLFAGTGAVGLEAASRGARRVLLVETGREALAALRRNIEALGLEESVGVHAADASRLGRARTAFDIVFMDPPYGSGLAPPAVEGVLRQGWLAPQGRIIVELQADEALTPPAGVTPVDERRYGRGRFVFLERADADTADPSG
jgi:16S rRNA (guanine966-N2)-methyltransferase